MLSTLVYTLSSAAAVAAVYYLLYFQPVAYTALINEDQSGEYAAAVAFGLTGLLLVWLGWRPGPYLRRVFWVVTGLLGIIAALEEVSWGERVWRGLFDVSMPAAVRDINVQGEFNLHNLEASERFLDHLYKIGSVLLLAWLLCSAALQIVRPGLAARLRDAGLPLIPIALSPLFLLAPYFFLLAPVVRAEEIGELSVSLAFAAWGLDLCLRHGAPRWRRSGPGATVGYFGIIAIAGIALSVASDASGRYRTHEMATYDFPAFGLYEQAERLFEHIYSDPRYVMPDTRIRHAKVLRASGQQQKAAEILRNEAAMIERQLQEAGETPDQLQRLGMVHQLLGNPGEAEAWFDRAIASYEHELSLTSDGDGEADLLWSEAQIWHLRGDLVTAFRKAAEAEQSAETARLRRAISAWIEQTFGPHFEGFSSDAGRAWPMRDRPPERAGGRSWGSRSRAAPGPASYRIASATHPF